MYRRLLLAPLVAAVAGCWVKYETSVETTERVNPAPAAEAGIDVVAKDHAGLMELVAGHKGKVVVVDAWSTWCEPCVTEFPGLVALYKKYGPERVACVSLSFDYEGGDLEEARSGVLAFLKQQGATFDNVLATNTDEMYEKLDFPSIPAVFVFDREGKLARLIDNSDPKTPNFTYADVEELVASLLPAAAD